MFSGPGRTNGRLRGFPAVCAALILLLHEAHRCNMLWRGATAAADDIEKTRLRPFTYLFCHRVGVEIVFTKGVG